MLNKAIIFSFFSLIAIMSACTEDTAPVAKPVADKITMNINGKDWTADSTSLTLSVNKKFYVLRGEKYITTGNKKTLGEVMIFNFPNTIDFLYNAKAPCNDKLKGLFNFNGTWGLFTFPPQYHQWQ